MKDRFFFGSGSVRRLFEFMQLWKVKKTLIVCGKKSYDSLYNKNEIESQLINVKTLRHSEFDINPNFDDLVRGADIVRKFQPDMILGIGGGSVMDTAKLLSIFPDSKKEIRQCIEGKEVSKKRKIHLVLVPTTAGSGSESTHFAVAYIGEKKYSVANQMLLSDCSLIDPECTYTMPKKLTAITAMDALSQAIESYWAVGSNEESMDYAVHSIELNIKSYKKNILAPDVQTRTDMMKASFLAGKAINISKTTAPHALSYFLTKNYGIPHGHAVGLTLGAFIKFNGAVDELSYRGRITYGNFIQKLKKLLVLLEVNSFEGASKLIRGMLEFAELPTKLSDIGVNKFETLDRLCKSVNIERLNNNPRLITNEQMLSVLKEVY